MGIDLLDLQFRVEREFNIQISSEVITQFLESGNTENPPEGAWTDTRVSDFVLLVKATIKEQHGEIKVDIFERVQFHIAACMNIPVESMTPNAWMVRDLGME